MSSAVVGFDVGSLTSYIGAAKGGGVEILANEVSDRCTPSCVAFSGKSRFLGSAAEQQMVTNISNTVTSFSRLVGKMENDPLVRFERQHTFFNIVADSQGRAAIKLKVNGESTILLPEQILAMHLHKLAEIAESSLGLKVVDVVLSVPSYYTDRERRAFLDASRIAGLNCMRLVNETTAIGIAYGLTKKDLPPVDQPPRYVAFVSLGNSNLQVAIVAFNFGKMKVISTAFDPCLGGRDFDVCIFNHLAKEIEERYKLKVTTSTKARVRLLMSCERLKKVMSTNSTEIPINVECLMNDTDISCKMKREFFESLCEPLLSRVRSTMAEVLTSSGLKPEELHSVELVGGGTRIPAVKRLVREVFGKEGSTTLNADEAVARGSAFQAAICSPAFKVREFSIVDACPYSISLQWQPTDEPFEAIKGEDAGEVAKGSTTELFMCFSNFPASKQIKFYRKSDFTLTAIYTHPERLHICNPLIGSFTITDIVSTPPGDFCEVRVKTRMNSNGIFTVSNATVMDRVEKEVEVPIEESKMETSLDVNAAGKKMETDGQSPKMEETSEPPLDSNAPSVATETPLADHLPTKPKTKIEKKTVLRPRDVPVEAKTSQLSREQLLEFTDFQAKLNQSDMVERERQHLKNALEAYVYEMRDKLETCLLQHTTETERDSFRKLLTETEDWIYDDGVDAKKSVISKRLDALKQVGDRYYLRYTEFDNRPSAVNALTNACEKIRMVLERYAAGDEKYQHLTKEDMAKVENALREKQQRLDVFLETSGKLKSTSDPTVFVADLYAAVKDLENVCNPIISRPKPAPPPPPINPNVSGSKTTGESTDGVGNAAPETSKAPGNVPNGGETAKTASAAPAGEDMDVD